MFQIVVPDHHTFVVHMYLLAGDVLATWAVGAGILWEGEAISVSHGIAKKLVLWGVILETVCSLALFFFDERISGVQQSTIEAQQSKIITLETHLAAIAPRGDLLRGTARDELIAALRLFSGQKVQTRFCELPFPVFDDEASVTAMLIAAALRDAGWQGEPTPHPVHAQGCGGSGIMVFASPSASPRTLNAANVLLSDLAGTLKNVGRLDNPGNLGTPPLHDPETIVVLVLSHPL